MRIGIDARLFGSVAQGLGRYTEKLITHLAQLDTVSEYYVFVIPGSTFPDLPQNFKIIQAPYRWYSIKEQIFWPFLLFKYRLDLMHFTHFNVPLLYRKPFVVTIHDLILLRFPTTHASTRHPFLFHLKYWGYRLVLKHAIRASEAIIAVSDFTAKDVASHFPFAANKVTTIYEAAGVEAYGQADPGEKERAAKPFLLYVGNAYPHKNLDYLVDQFSAWSKNHPEYMLRLVGKNDFFYGRLQRSIQGVHSSVEILYNTNDAELARLYRSARAFVFPSLYEGFGLPALEALAYNLPVLACNRGALPEILGDAALYFDPEDGADFQKKLTSLVSDEETRSRLISAGRKRYPLFSWTKTAERTHSLYVRLQNEYNRAVLPPSYGTKKRAK